MGLLVNLSATIKHTSLISELNYKPVMYFIDVYSGAPRTEDVIRREEKAGEARKRMDRNNDEN